MKKRFLSIFISISLLIGLFPAVTTTARATGDITLSVQNDVIDPHKGTGSNWGETLTSGEAGSDSVLSPDSGIEIYFTDLSRKQAGVVNTLDLIPMGVTGIGFFHADSNDPTITYEGGVSTGQMVIRKTDGSNFSFKKMQATFGGNLTLVITEYKGNTTTGFIDYTVSDVSNGGSVDRTLDSSILTSSIFQNVDKVTVSGKNYENGLANDQLDTTVLLTKSVTIGAPILPDTAPPVLSDISADNIKTGEASLHFTSDEAGTYYYLVYAEANNAPDAQTTKALGAKGTDTAIKGTNTASISGLTESTKYKAYIVVEDAAKNLSGVGSCSFTTSSKTVVSEAAVTVTAPVLWRMEGESSVAAASSFEDVASDRYYADATDWAATNNIVKGYDRLRYGPEDDITREQLAAILYRYAQYKGYNVSDGKDTNILSYTDANTTSEYVIPAMQWAVGAGLIEGSTNNSLMPTTHATRAQATAILQRFVQNVAK